MKSQIDDTTLRLKKKEMVTNPCDVISIDNLSSHERKVTCSVEEHFIYFKQINRMLNLTLHETVKDRFKITDSVWRNLNIITLKFTLFYNDHLDYILEDEGYDLNGIIYMECSAWINSFPALFSGVKHTFLICSKKELSSYVKRCISYKPEPILDSLEKKGTKRKHMERGFIHGWERGMEWDVKSCPEGSYGEIFFNKEMCVACKKMKNETSAIDINAYKEVIILNHLLQFPHENVLSLLRYGCMNDGDRIIPYVLVPMYDMDLNNFCKHVKREKIAKKKVGLNMGLMLTRGLVHLHKIGVAHRDLKPGNILVKSDTYGKWELVIADYGSSTFYGNNLNFCYNVTTVWFAPFECLTNWGKNVVKVEMDEMKIDSWSLGCILAGNLSDGRNIFNGKNENQTVKLQKNTIGYDSKTGILNLLPDTKQWPGKIVGEGIEGTSPFFKSSVDRLLVMDPFKRAKPEEILPLLEEEMLLS